MNKKREIPLVKNRIYKFRAWDKEIGRMYYVGGATIYKIIKASEECEDKCWLLNTDHVLMQYTGLNDKNGKEIYEGDILELCGSKGIVKVVWHFNRWAIRNEKNRLEEFNKIDFEGGFFEVIGNIYENK